MLSVPATVTRLLGRSSGPVERDPLPEADGHYDDIPYRVRDYVLEQNTEDEIIWMTTVCDGPVKYIHVQRTAHGGWVVKTRHGSRGSQPTQSLGHITGDDWGEDTELRRALWHARQVMEGRNLSPPERGDLRYFLTDPPTVKEVDLFFEAPPEERTDPFADYIRDAV